MLPFPAVKTLRIWLLLTLAVLLPVRGVMAAVMLCPNSGVHERVQQHVHEHHHMDGMHASHQESASHHHEPNGHAHTGADKCNLCSTCCSAPPMPGTFTPTVAAELTPSAIVFPRLTATASTYWSDGPERPPRST